MHRSRTFEMSAVLKILSLYNNGIVNTAEYNPKGFYFGLVQRNIMNKMIKDSSRHILVFEPRTEGHHLTWLRYVVEDFLSAGHTLTLAIGYTNHTRGLYKTQLGDLLEKVAIMSVYDANLKLRGGTKINALGHCMNDCGAEQVFCNNLDDIASSMLRRSAIGIFPPKVLKGKLSGVYFRPRFLARATWPPGNLIKLIGFRRLLR